jgi:hypothetical protein
VPVANDVRSTSEALAPGFQPGVVRTASIQPAYAGGRKKTGTHDPCVPNIICVLTSSLRTVARYAGSYGLEIGLPPRLEAGGYFLEACYARDCSVSLAGSITPRLRVAQTFLSHA